jgi:hypothetical protein
LLSPLSVLVVYGEGDGDRSWGVDTQSEAGVVAARKEAWEEAQRQMAAREATRATGRAAAAERTAAAWLQEARERVAGARIVRAVRRCLDHRGAAVRAKGALQQVRGFQ